MTVELSRGSTGEGLGEVVANLYQYWLPGVEPPSFEDAQPEEAAAPATSDEGGEELSAAAQRVPAHLLGAAKPRRTLGRQKRLTRKPSTVTQSSKNVPSVERRGGNARHFA